MQGVKVKVLGAAAVFTLLGVLSAVLFLNLPVSRSEVILSSPTPQSTAAPSRPLVSPPVRAGAEEEVPALSPVEAAEAAELLPASGETASEFILRQYGESIGVFEAGAEYPFMIIEVPVSSLRAADAEALRSGISVLGRMELAQLVEDLGS